MLKQMRIINLDAHALQLHQQLITRTVLWFKIKVNINLRSRHKLLRKYAICISYFLLLLLSLAMPRRVHSVLCHAPHMFAQKGSDVLFFFSL
jgi:hypothetical protein